MKNSPILPGATIGILGSGQLGRMLAIEARNMGYSVRVLSPQADTPCGQIADAEVIADYEDISAVSEFARTVSVVTYEFENVPSATVAAIESAGVPVRPGPDVLHVAQNRLREKRFFHSLAIPTTPFARIISLFEIAPAIAEVGLPAVLKTAGSGYDGKGQRVVRTETEAGEAFNALGQVECILEGFVDFAWEGSVVAARGISGDFADYGLVENSHSRHILDVSTAPAPRATPAMTRTAVLATRAVMEKLDMIGVLCVEYFVTATGELIANEMAPRPHNSGHWTMGGAVTNQFEQQLRAVCGLGLGDTRMVSGGSAVANLLGDLWRDATPDFSGMLADFPDVKLHMYGKSEARSGRKMGHVNMTAETAVSARARVNDARTRLSTVENVATNPR